MILTFKEKSFDQGEGQRGPWTRYDYWWRERKEKTSIFDNEDNAEAITFLEELKPGQKVDVTLEAKKSGKYTNYTILDVKAVDGKPETTAPLQQATPENIAVYQADGTEVSQDVWAAKDRALDMQSAYKSMSHFHAGTDVDFETLVNHARFLYSDMQRARMSETLGVVKAPAQKEP